MALKPLESTAYGVLTHQAIIDVAWKPSLVPLLKKKFPEATPEQLQQAHAHAYGGAIIQDMGYYPFGNTFFTDLTHYVRSGDFIIALLEEAHTLNEYAFGLGALAHYYADNYGHPLGTNLSVPLVYPEMKATHGTSVTYEENPLAHVKMEFGFDVLQVARGNYAPEAYRDFIGFEVSQESLERAFQKTYGLKLGSLFVNLKLTIGSFRRSVSTLIPSLTKAAWNLKASDIRAAKPSTTRREYLYRIRKTDYHQKWGREYQQPNLFQKALSWLLRVLPKIGPNRALSFKPPTPAAEKLFMESFNVTSQQYSSGLLKLSSTITTLSNTDLDTGDRTKLGNYGKADETYAAWLEKLDKEEFATLTPEMKKNLLQFYSKAPTPKQQDKKTQEEWEKTKALLTKVKALN
ncbi:zinc dependent phospholipase C family protein [Rufibacter sediminis]|uniref:Zinc dependent phospholipase C family protein n=1 Tax=Rufibacter sediminis TaxID=2762756 RepID=A0ABR6VYU1_9BACT|nr:zinc dependent phospholipase C family protein [Rufibacter sediminis]MBC3542380.1 zinc dependent phospholipase C family protein [Rufibacter sediminis]